MGAYVQALLHFCKGRLFLVLHVQLLRGFRVTSTCHGLFIRKSYVAPQPILNILGVVVLTASTWGSFCRNFRALAASQHCANVMMVFRALLS